MEIVLVGEFNINTSMYCIRVDFYKSHEAFLHPDQNEGEIWNCCCDFDFRDLGQLHKLDLIPKLLSIIETSVNSCLSESEKGI